MNIVAVQGTMLTSSLKIYAIIFGFYLDISKSIC